VGALIATASNRAIDSDTWQAPLRALARARHCGRSVAQLTARYRLALAAGVLLAAALQAKG